MASYTPRPPLLPWSASTWSDRWSAQGRLSTTAIPRTPFLLLKAPVSTLYEEKFGGDRNMFTVGMYCSRMMARSIRVGLVIDCTALDIEDFEPFPANSKSTSSSKFDRRVRYFHNPSEWDDYDVEYHRLLPPKQKKSASSATTENEKHESNDNDNNEPLAPQVLDEFYHTVSNFIQKSRSSSSSASGNNIKTHIALFDSRGGLGASSYLVAAYMCHVLRAPVHVALDAIKEGTPLQPNEDTKEDKERKWGCCDVRLVMDLQTRFRGRREIRLLEEGGTPSWWWDMDEDDDEDEDDVENGNEDEKKGVEDGGVEKSPSKRKRKMREESVIIIPPFSGGESTTSSDDISKRARGSNNEHATNNNNGNTLYPNLPREILEPVSKGSPKWNRAVTVLAQMTNSEPSAIETNLPLKPEVDISCSIDDINSKILQKIKSNSHDYKITWLSTRGRRGLLLLLSEAVYFLEQVQSSPSSSISISIVTNMKFPTPKDITKVHHRTLLDVVLVKDNERGNAATFRFYVLDILCIEGGTIYHKPFEQRWRYLNEGVLLPRKKDEAHQQQQQKQQHAYAKEGIKLRAKEYFPLNEKKLNFVLKDVCNGVAHDAEGVRIISLGDYGITTGKESGGQSDNDNKVGVTSVVWQRRKGDDGDGIVDDDKLKSLLLV